LHTWQRHLVLTCAVAAVALVLAGAARAWTWPLPGPVLRPYVFDPELPLEPGQHRGIDVQGALGAPVLAPVAGRVSFVGSVPTGGRTITIESADGYSATLLHLGPALVQEGARVDEGAAVALVGTSGVPEHALPYVHFGIRLTADPQGYLDPQLLLPPLAAPPAPGDPLPTPDPQPAPTAPPVTAPPAPAPPAVVPSPTDGPTPRTAAPVGGAPQRPLAQADPRSIAVAPALRSPAPAATVSSAPLAAAGSEPGLATPPAALAVRPADATVAAAPGASPAQPDIRAHAAIAPAAAQPTWLRISDPFSGPEVERVSRVEPRSLPRPGLVAMLVALAASVILCARAFARKVARIIGADALLPDDTDLLREREPAYRARVHDDRGRRRRPAPQAAR
jgi:hypothetical protein